MLDGNDIEVLPELLQKSLTNSDNIILKEIDRIRQETNQRMDKLEYNMELKKKQRKRIGNHGSLFS